MPIKAALLVVSAVVIGVEDSGITLPPQQDDGVGEGFEPAFHHRFQCLQRLGVVVVDQGDGEQWHLLHQGAIQDCAHVEVATGAAGAMEVVV